MEQLGQKIWCLIMSGLICSSWPQQVARCWNCASTCPSGKGSETPSATCEHNRRNMTSLLHFFSCSDFHTDVRCSDALLQIDIDNALSKITLRPQFFSAIGYALFNTYRINFLKNQKWGTLITFMWPGGGGAGEHKSDKIITYR